MAARALVSAILFVTYLAPPDVDAASPARPFIATAYCLKGETGSGSRTRPGIVAADPRVLPTGTRVRVLTARGGRTYTVEDRGVKGRHIDIFMPSCHQARRFGRRHVRVRVLRIGNGRRLGP